METFLSLCEVERSETKQRERKSRQLNDNAGLIICRQGQAVGSGEWNVVFTCKYLTDQNIYRRGGGTIFPLYLYPETNGQQTIEKKDCKRKPNLNQEIVNKIAKNLDLTFTNEKETLENTFAPIDILDYTNLISNSPIYFIYLTMGKKALIPIRESVEELEFLYKKTSDYKRKQRLKSLIFTKTNKFNTRLELSEHLGIGLRTLLIGLINISQKGLIQCLIAQVEELGIVLFLNP